MDETMLHAGLRLTCLQILLVAISTIIPAVTIAQDDVAQTNPMQVTTDTPEYCLHLLDRVSTLARAANTPVPREVTDLTTEGHRMCVHGQTRGGIMRLRSALMIMRKNQDTGTSYR